VERVERVDGGRDRWRCVGENMSEYLGREQKKRNEGNLAESGPAKGGAPAAQDVSRERAADAEPSQEHGENDGERVDGRAEEQRQNPRPHHLGAESRQSRQSGGEVNPTRS